MNILSKDVGAAHPFFNGGDYDTGRRFINWLEQILSENACRQLGLPGERRDKINQGDEGVTEEELRKALVAVRSRWPNNWKNDEEYQFFDGLLQSEDLEAVEVASGTSSATELNGSAEEFRAVTGGAPVDVLPVLPVGHITHPTIPTLRRTRDGFWVGEGW